MKKIILIAGLLSMSACSMAEHYTPVVDMQGVNSSKYASALETCRGYARQVDVIGDSLTGVAAGGLGGAMLGSALGAVGGSPGNGAAVGASIGGAGYGGTIYQNAQQRQIRIINNCLKKRGFYVLG